MLKKCFILKAVNSNSINFYKKLQNLKNAEFLKIKTNILLYFNKNLTASDVPTGRISFKIK